MCPGSTSQEELSHTSIRCDPACLTIPATFVCTPPATTHSLYNLFSMENFELQQVIKKFDNFVQSSLSHKEDQVFPCPTADCKVQAYLSQMEKRLKLKPRSQEQKFESLLKPMKDLKSFVSVREFMESLGTNVAGRVGEKIRGKGSNKNKLSKEGLRGTGGFLERAQQHLRSKRFNWCGRSPPLCLTQIEDHSLQRSEYRTFVENALNVSASKNDPVFKKAANRLSKEPSQKPQVRDSEAERDCLIQEHEKEYADQFKVVPHMREICEKEYNSFAKISSLLTGRLRKILKNNCAGRNSIVTIKNPALAESFERREVQQRDIRQTVLEKPAEKEKTGLKKSHIRKTTCQREGKENPIYLKASKKRVHTAGIQRREGQGWRQAVNSRLQCIINEGDNE